MIGDNQTLKSEETAMSYQPVSGQVELVELIKRWLSMPACLPTMLSNLKPLASLLSLLYAFGLATLVGFLSMFICS